MYKVEQATAEDAKEILQMTLAFTEASPFKEFDVDEEYMSFFIHGVIASDDALMLLLKKDEEVVGMLAAVINSQHPLMNRSKIAAELVWWVDPDHRGKSSLSLVKHLEEWAKAKECSYVTMSCLDEKVATLYENLGFKKTEMQYMRKI